MHQQPEFFVTTPDQMQFMVSNQEDAVWYDHDTRTEMDIDELFEIDMVKDIVLDTEDN